ncbi:MAG: hypothetical protein HYX78_08545 [Armatimonadetes bacterium]|nr:hypothetical protein [Armatimonadota bacterium]
MFRTFILAHWEMRRIWRSRASLAALILFPVAAAAAYVFVPDNLLDREAFRPFFAPAAVVLAWTLLYARSFSDRASGFAAGLESVPAAGAIVLGGRFVTGIVIAAIQSAAFYATMSLVR